MISHLVYTADCVKFFQTHRREISDLLKELMNETGEFNPANLFNNPRSLQWEESDPLAQEDTNRNILAWFGFETVARNLAERNGIEL